VCLEFYSELLAATVKTQAEVHEGIQEEVKKSQAVFEAKYDRIRWTEEKVTVT